MSNLSDLCAENGITPEALVATSKALEAQSVADRELLVKRADARRVKDKDKKTEEAEIAKPAGLGRGVSICTVQRAWDGAPQARLVRKKILRAVNAQLASQKKDAVDVRAAFGDVGSKKGKKA